MEEQKVLLKEVDLQIIRDMQVEIDEYKRFVEWLYFVIVKGDKDREAILFETGSDVLIHAITRKIWEDNHKE